MSLLTAFNIGDGKWTPYASYLIIEVYEMTDGSFSMRVLYNGQQIKLPFCGGSEMCDIDTAKKYVETVVPKDRETECL